MSALQTGIYSLAPSSVVTTWNAPHNRINQPSNSQGHQFKVVDNIETRPSKGCHCYIVPPHLQTNIEKHKIDKAFRKHRISEIKTAKAFNFRLPHPFEKNEDLMDLAYPNDSTAQIQKLVRNVYNARNTEYLPGRQALSSIGKKGISGYIEKIKNPALVDGSVRKAHENSLQVFLFYLKKYRYNSIDGKGMPLNSTVHFGDNYGNAFWNGSQMVYGDGDSLFQPFVNYLDVVGHELTHGVTGDRLEYEGEAGALNEHFSDVMGYLAYMYTNKLDFNQANWLLADGILKYEGRSYALRSFAKPGTAYDDPEIGKDPQPSKYGDLYTGEEDNGGVHINSGIANHAFYLFARALKDRPDGKYPWKIAGLIWFETMMTPNAFKYNASMKEFAQAIIKTTDTLFKEDQQVRDAIRAAWKEVEVIL